MTNPMCTYADLSPDNVMHEEVNLDQYTYAAGSMGGTFAKGKYYVDDNGTLTVQLGTEAKWYLVDIQLPVDVLAQMLSTQLNSMLRD